MIDCDLNMIQNFGILTFADHLHALKPKTHYRKGTTPESIIGPLQNYFSLQQTAQDARCQALFSPYGESVLASLIKEASLPAVACQEKQMVNGSWPSKAILSLYDTSASSWHKVCHVLPPWGSCSLCNIQEEKRGKLAGMKYAWV